MKFRQIFLFELKYQLRYVSTWIYFIIPTLFPLVLAMISQSTDENEYLNSPHFIVFVTVVAGIIWLLTGGAIAGSAAARDVQSQLYPLTYTTPISKLEYLGGRFTAAFTFNVLIQVAVVITFLCSIYIPGIQQGLLGPFRAGAYLTTFLYLVLPNVFIATAFQFSAAVLERRAIVAYIAAIMLFPIASPIIGTSVAKYSNNWELWKLFDVMGVSVAADVDTWTTFEKNTRLLELKGMFLWNRLAWIAFAVGVLAYAYFRFQFAHITQTSWWRRNKRKKDQDTISAPLDLPPSPIPVPRVNPTFGVMTNVRQTRAIAWSSFRMIARSVPGLGVLGFFGFQLILFADGHLRVQDVPQYPTAMAIIKLISAAVSDVTTPLMIIPMLIVFFAGELVWREREAGLSKISDIVPVSEWILLLGKFLGLSLIIVVWLAVLMVAGVLIQVFDGYYNFEVGVFIKTLFGIQLVEYLLFALLAIVIHVVINHKYVGHMVVLFVFLFLVFHSRLGIEHNLLVFNETPGWSYTDMRGFEPHVAGWLWFKIYWIGWAILLAVAAKLLWVRSMSQGLRARIRLTQNRLTKSTTITAAIATVIIVIAGGYVFYNTNILNDYDSSSEKTEQKALYEKTYSKHKDDPQPMLKAVKLHVDIFPAQRKADIRGSYTLINNTVVAINTIHLSDAPGIDTESITFDQQVANAIEDERLGYNTYTLVNPVQPGDSIILNFEVHLSSRGFNNGSNDTPILQNGTYFINYHSLPSIGYIQDRELNNDGERKKFGLAPRQPLSLYDTVSDKTTPWNHLIDLEAIVGTDIGQVGIAPGKLVRNWTENGRSYFQYATSAPIRNTYPFFSGKYSLNESKWNDVDIRVYYHPTHAENIDRVVKSARAALTYFTNEFGPYPYRHLTIIERSGYEGFLNGEPSSIDYGESFTLSNVSNPGTLDIVYFAIAHEVAHQWWGASQIMPARGEGGMLLSETLANYSGLKVLGQAYGDAQVRQLLNLWRNSYAVPRQLATTPLLRATDSFLGYRKGPLAFYALSQYVGTDAVNHALRQLVTKHGSGKPPLPTSLDLYRELNDVTPDTLKYLLQDYFEKNVYWRLKTESATAKEIDSTHWEVTLKLEANKVEVDSTGAETTLPMNDWIEVGIYSEDRSILHLQKHRIKDGKETITIIVPGKPRRAGIDPNSLLIDLNPDNNTRNVNLEGEKKDSGGLI